MAEGICRPLGPKKTFALLAVTMMMLSVFAGIGEYVDDSEGAADSWVCTITVDGTGLETKYSKNGATLDATEAVNGITQSAGSWGFDADGYGPFNSFYAAFDPSNDNEMVCHLDPNDLTKAVGGGTTVEVDGRTVNISDCNIMWCLPKIYLSVDGNTMTLASSGTDDQLAPAFTLKDSEGNTTNYNYLALGVYEATYDSSKLGSVSGESPQGDASLAEYRTEAKANDMTEGSEARLWNFHQYQLYRLCSLAVMENFDSQTQIGYGNSFSSDAIDVQPSTTGNMDAKGPYYGTTDPSGTGVKLFIENAWGSLWEYVDDAVWYAEYNDDLDRTGGGLYVGQNENPSDETDHTSDKILLEGLPWTWGYGTAPYSTNIYSWGLPMAVSDEGEWSTTAPDSICDDSEASLLVGGDIKSQANAGLSCLDSDCWGNTGGSRLVFLFTTDPVTTSSVTYDMDGGTPRIPPASVQKGQNYTIPDTVPEKDGYVFGGWRNGTETYGPGDTIEGVIEDIALTAVWGHSVTFDLGGGTWDLDTGFVEDGEDYTIPETEPQLEGSVFKGWSDGTSMYGPGDTIGGVVGNIVLTAVWEGGPDPDPGPGPDPEPTPRPLPIIPDDGTADGDHPVVIVLEDGKQPWLWKNGKTYLIIAIIAAIIAELAVLAYSRHR